jgi:ssRNA-specific RNase YbeY (16S rRNA maturation enzyme)
LNNDYRQKDSVTDVLSFHYYEDFSDLEVEETAGEVILCESKIYSQ